MQQDPRDFSKQAYETAMALCDYMLKDKRRIKQFLKPHCKDGVEKETVKLMFGDIKTLFLFFQQIRDDLNEEFSEEEVADAK